LSVALSVALTGAAAAAGALGDLGECGGGLEPGGSPRTAGAGYQSATDGEQYGRNDGAGRGLRAEVNSNRRVGGLAGGGGHVRGDGVDYGDAGEPEAYPGQRAAGAGDD
jgi:hypothetical protein